MNPEPSATQASSTPPIVRTRSNWALRAILVLVFAFTVQHARALLLPIVIAVVLTFMLAPVVRSLRKFHMNDAISAALVVLALLAGLVIVGSALTGPALSWWERAPSNMQQLTAAVDRLRSSLPLFAPPESQPKQPARNARNAPPPQPQPDPLKERIASEGVEFTRVLFLQFTSFAVSAAATVMLLYFLLASERWLIARTVQAIPRPRARALLLSGVRQAQRDISHFFATQLFINCGVGAAVATTSWWLDLPNPLLWGITIGVLNFIPYLGPTAAAVMMLVAGVLTFDTLPSAVAPALALIGVHAIESNIVSPLVVGRRLELNPLAVFVSVLLWGWLWGIPGALIAVPVLLGLRIACRRIRAMRKFAMYLERNGDDLPSLRSLIRSPRRLRVRPVHAGVGRVGATRQAPREDL
ncbi:MAG TPA: AI-2E family transporter [Burkholderiaceae bacterium]|nr:AI-2E family transporter [Burkholderiaceae bacterium]